MSLSNNFPTVSPTLNLNFAAAGRLDSRVTFTRSSTATYTNQIGLIQSAAVNEPRFDYDPVTLAARGLLVEESRTNLLTYSEQFDNAAWKLRMLADRRPGEAHPLDIGSSAVARYFKIEDECAQAVRLKLVAQQRDATQPRR